MKYKEIDGMMKRFLLLFLFRVNADNNKISRSVNTQKAPSCSAELQQMCSICYPYEQASSSDVEKQKYNCTLPGLEYFTPGQYAGVQVNYLSYATSTSSPNMPIRAGEFEACTGGKIIFSEAKNVFEDPIADLGTITGRGQEVYDGYFMSYSHFPEASSLGLAEHLNERVRKDINRLDWADVLPKVRHMGEYRTGVNTTNLDFLMYDGDFFVPVVRLDLLEKFNLSLPNTWSEVVDIAKFFHDTDLNDDGEPDCGFCHFPRLGAGFWDWWWPEAVYATWATHSQTQGMDQGFFFDADTMEPQISTAGFQRAAEIWKDLWAHGCTTDTFYHGRCAIGYAPPGDWKGLFLNYPGVNRKDENDTIIWTPKFKNGEYAEPYRFRPFGSMEVVDPATNTFVPCTPELCPLAEVIIESGHNGANDRASKVLPPSPHVGKLINRPPFYWSGGLGTLIRKSSPIEKKDLMWDFFVYTNSPETAVSDVASYRSWLDSWRYSQLTPGINFINAGWSLDSYVEHKEVMFWALGADNNDKNNNNGALNLRIPGLKRYTHEVVGAKMLEYINEELTLEQMSSHIEQAWIDITSSYGKLKQLEIYRASLNIKPHSEVDLCRLHRIEMDNLDPSICPKYDPSTGKIIIPLSIIIPLVLVVILSGVALLYMDRKRRAADSVWSIKSNELNFYDPPEIIGRGTFGLVLLAEYRGTKVAVKRVIPPKGSASNGGWIEAKINRMKTSLSTTSETKACSSFDHDTSSPTKSSNEDEFQEEPSFAASPGFSSTKHLPSDDSSSKEGSSKASVPRILPRLNSITSIRNITTSNPENDVFDDAESAFSKEKSATMGFESGLKSGKIKDHGYTVVKGLMSSISALSSGSYGPNLKRKKKKKNSKDEYNRLKVDFVEEMRILSKLRHPCITTVMGAVIEKRKEPMLVMEYMDHGSLFDLLHNETVLLDGQLVFPILRDIAQGVRFLHAAIPKVIHGDLKAANVLVDGKFRAKVADFGLSQKKKVGATGTPYWMAPELLRGESDCSSSSDVYSFGILLYEVYSRKAPYQGEEYENVIRDICDPLLNKRPPIPTACPLQIQSLISDCVAASPENRPTFEEIDERLKRMNADLVAPGEIKLSHQMMKQTNRLLNDVFPPKIAEALRSGKKVEPEHREVVTIFFSDIVGFTSISAKLSPMKVSDMLDRLYQVFDNCSRKHDVFKVETIGDAYMAVTNLVKDQPDDHAARIARFAFDAIEAAGNTLVDVDDPSLGNVSIRVGFHCGPVVANVVGSRNPRYCLFGDSVNTSSRMESNSKAGRVHCSERAATILIKQAPNINLISRGKIEIKGKGEMHTFWVVGEDDSK